MDNSWYAVCHYSRSHIVTETPSDTMLGKKWKPRYFSSPNALASPTEEQRKSTVQVSLSESAVLIQTPAASGDSHLAERKGQISTGGESNPTKPNKKRKVKNSDQLSTKSVLQYL